MAAALVEGPRLTAGSVKGSVAEADELRRRVIKLEAELADREERLRLWEQAFPQHTAAVTAAASVAVASAEQGPILSRGRAAPDAGLPPKADKGATHLHLCHACGCECGCGAVSPLPDARKKARCSLVLLHEDLLNHALSYFGAAELARCTCTSAMLAVTCAANDPRWADLYQRRFGELKGGRQPSFPPRVTSLMTSCFWKHVFGLRATTDNNWRSGKAQCTLTLRGHTGTVTCLASDGATGRIVSGSDDGSLVLWSLHRVSDSSADRRLRPPPALALAQLAERRRTSSSSSSSSSSSAKPSHRLGTRNRGFFATSLIPNPNSPESLPAPAPRLTGASGGAGAELCDFGPGGPTTEWQATRLRAFHGHGGPIWCLDLDLRRGRLMSGGYDKTIKLWDVASGRCERTLRGHTGWVSCLKGQYEGSTIVSGSWDSTIRLWDADAGATRATLGCGLGNALYCLDWDQQTGTVAVGCRHRHVQLWDIAAGRRVGDCTGHGKEVGALQMTSAALVTGSGDSTVKVWDRPTAECRLTLKGHSSTVMCVKFDGAFKVVSGSYDKTTCLWDLRKPSGPVHRHAMHEGAVFALTFDEDQLATGSSDCTVKVLRFRQEG